MKSIVTFVNGTGEERRIDVSGVEAVDVEVHAKNILNALLSSEGQPVDGWKIRGTVTGPSRQPIERATEKAAKETR